jgi:hypothetical protein
MHQFIDPLLSHSRWHSGFARQLSRQFLLFHAPGYRASPLAQPEGFAIHWADNGLFEASRAVNPME